MNIKNQHDLSKWIKEKSSQISNWLLLIEHWGHFQLPWNQICGEPYLICRMGVLCEPERRFLDVVIVPLERFLAIVRREAQHLQLVHLFHFLRFLKQFCNQKSFNSRNCWIPMTNKTINSTSEPIITKWWAQLWKRLCDVRILTGSIPTTT